MASFGIDHAYLSCPHYKREVRTKPVYIKKWSLFFNPDAEWALDPAYPDETVPFGLCGWCWRVYQARQALS